MKTIGVILRSAKLMSSVAAEAATNGLPMNNVIRLGEGPSLASHAERAAAAALLAGHVISVPTDTLYGIAALAQNNTAIERIYEIKRRSSTKPLAICVSEVDEVYLWGKVTVPHSLLTSLLPGPVTLVFQRTAQLNPALNPGTDLVGIRIPDEEFIRSVVKSCGSPLALTSANISTKASPLCVEEFRELWSKLHTVFDGGPLGEHLKCREGSTIIDLSQPGSYRLIRRGIAFEQTSEILQRYKLCLID
ncbi:yrdC domain-containing protein, mitochondrial-like [Homarus americanus]|uniref:yrdC domain-containing protein, mitochondrial-like n=1 Tax=Homarus americanus TaxID=6706 RepID=UPI001C46FABD|nr:yrdC domain-containing protein, mitochondrial-like [Homarus americanus]